MKKLLLLIGILLTINSCSQKDNPILTPLEQLPKATQTGENTFGCLLDGNAFIPNGGTNPLDCVYQLINGNYYFALQGNKRDSENNLILIGLSTNALQTNESQLYSLIENASSNAYGSYAFSGFFSETNSIHTGELTISKLDEINQIVSGTFWFDVVDNEGIVHQIREGRFDMQYTQ